MNESATAISAENEGLHLLDYLAIVRQRLPVAIGVFLAVVILTGLYAWTRTPRFTATSRLLIENRGVNLTAMQDAYDPGRANVAQRDMIQTQVQLITSTPVLEDVLRSGLLAQSEDFLKARDPVKQLAQLVKVTPARSGYVLDVSVTRENPTEAAKIVNAVVEAYLTENRARRMGVSDDGIAELKKKAESMRGRLDTETAELQAFMVSNRMVSFEDAQNIVVERLKGLNKNLMAAEPVRMEAESRYRTAKASLDAGISVDSIPDVLSNPLVIELKGALFKIEQQYSDLKDRLGENHQQIQSLTAQMTTLRTKMAMEAANIVDGLRGRYEQALSNENMLKKELEAQEAEVLRFNELSARYNLLRQSRDSVQEAYSAIIRRIDELDVSQLSGQGDNVFVIARAEVPQEKSWPSRSKMLLIGIFLGALLAVGTCFFLDYMDTTIKGETDVRTYLGHSILGGIPSAERENEGDFNDFFALKSPQSHFAESFRTTRTALAFSVTDAPLRALVVTSTFPAEGKSLAALNLAMAYAQAGKRTLLVDTDMRKPRLRELFPGAPKNGISDLLVADSTLEPAQALFATSIANLTFLGAGTVPPNPVELLDSARFGSLLDQLRADFEMIIFDAPPALTMVDALVLGKKTDGLIMVTRAFVTNKYAARQMIRQIAAAHVKVLGILLNNVDTPAGSYGDYATYGYYRYGSYSTPGTSSDAPAPKSGLWAWLSRATHRGDPPKFPPASRT